MPSHCFSRLLRPPKCTCPSPPYTTASASIFTPLPPSQAVSQHLLPSHGWKPRLGFVLWMPDSPYLIPCQLFPPFRLASKIILLIVSVIFKVWCLFDMWSPWSHHFVSSVIFVHSHVSLVPWCANFSPWLGCYSVTFSWFPPQAYWAPCLLTLSAPALPPAQHRVFVTVLASLFLSTESASIRLALPDLCSQSFT